ncbi:hypothetical protein EI94DRAFT_1740792 [Lactarius quietus]|nr:hypothetical protein EI94DRAFT_1758072 [Lactarius quietus]KAF8263481.1 hypothetical protein EI94DRAFT_1740792 [Lactarius quietus]
MPGSAIVDLSTSYGATLIGFIVSIALFGFTLGQTWMYFWHYWNKDTKALKFFIAFITVMDTTHTVIVAYGLHWYLVQNFGNLEALAANTWFLDTQGNISGIYSSAVQLYYARQIYLLSKNIIPPIIILILTVVGNSLALYITVKVLAATRISDRYHSIIWPTRIGMGQCVVVDVLIAAMMCWALYRKKTGLASTDSMIITFMAYTINSGLLTSLLGAAMTISFIVLPESLLPVAIFFPMGKCYVNSVLAMLNSRDYVRGRSSPDNSNNSFKLTSLRVTPPSDALDFEPLKSKSRQTDGSVMHRLTASNYARKNSDDNVGHTFEVPKLETDIASQSQSSDSNV